MSPLTRIAYSLTHVQPLGRLRHWCVWKRPRLPGEAHALNKPDDFILAIVQVDGDEVGQPHYVRKPFQKEPDFGVTSVNYDVRDLLARADPPS